MIEHGGQFFALAKQRGFSPEQALEQIIDLSASVNPNLPQLKPTLNPALWRHYPPSVDQELIQLLANKFQLDAKNIQLCHGISSAILSLFAHFRPATTVLYTPIYSEYQRAAHIYSQQVIEIKRDISTNAPSVITALLSHPIPKNSWVVWVNPSTPDGQYNSPSELQALIEYWQQQDCWLIMDESFLPFLGLDSDLSLRGFIQQWPKLIIMQSLTKYYACPGLRLGAVFAHADLLNAWPQPAWPISWFDSEMLRQALSDTEFDAHNHAWLSDAKTDLLQHLNQHPLIKQVWPSSANFVLAQTHLPAQKLAYALSEQGVLVRPCDSFGLGADYLRIAVHSHPVHQRLIEALNQINRANSDAVV